MSVLAVEALDRKIGSHLRRWLGLSSITLYGHNNKMQLPLRFLEEEFKLKRTREVLQYRESIDPKMAKAQVTRWR